jgi:uncharacterized membrane protein
MTAPSPPAGRAVKIALAISLALNLVVVGIVGGTLLRRVGEPPRPVVRDLGFGPFALALSPDDRAALQRAFEAEGPGMRGLRRKMHDDLAGLLAALRAEPFDSGALRAALEAQDTRARERLDLGQRLLADRLIAMSDVERRAFADRLQAALARLPGGGAVGRHRGGEGREGRGEGGSGDD